jgi:hypothetical protein
VLFRFSLKSRSRVDKKNPKNNIGLFLSTRERLFKEKRNSTFYRPDARQNEINFDLTDFETNFVDAWIKIFLQRPKLLR